MKDMKGIPSSEIFLSEVQNFVDAIKIKDYCTGK